jgi:enoyl-CoA hydratase
MPLDHVCPEPMVLVEQPAPGVVLLRLNRSKARNALTMALREELARHFRRLDECHDTRVIILTGSDTVFFAAGADVGEMVDATALEIYARHAERHWQAISECRKPVIAAVNGFALGGGCELAMHCDLIIAGTSARFAQPEVKVGVMPGAGGTQRSVRAIGKFQTLCMLLTGCQVTAEDALRMGLFSEVVADAETLSSALATAIVIADMPPIAIAQIKEVVLAGMDLPLEQSLVLERKSFQLLFGSRDQKEGMQAFYKNANRSISVNEPATIETHRFDRYWSHGAGHRPGHGLGRLECLYVRCAPMCGEHGASTTGKSLRHVAKEKPDHLASGQ